MRIVFISWNNSHQNYTSLWREKATRVFRFAKHKKIVKIVALHHSDHFEWILAVVHEMMKNSVISRYLNSTKTACFLGCARFQVWNLCLRATNGFQRTIAWWRCICLRYVFIIHCLVEFVAYSNRINIPLNSLEIVKIVLVSDSHRWLAHCTVHGTVQRTHMSHRDYAHH